MKKLCWSFTFILLAICIVMQCSQALASNSYGLHLYNEEPSASKKILIYHQYGDKQADWQNKRLDAKNQYTSKIAYMGSRNGSQNGWGCGIYALAHAIQWASGQKKSTTNGGAFLDEFIKIFDAPWVKGLESTYSSIIKKYGVEKNTPTKSITGLKDFFAKGGALRTYIGTSKNHPKSGHYQIAVGIAEGKNSEIWVHMVDSTCYATIDRLKDKGQSAYNFTTGNTQSSTAVREGGEYWVSYNTFSKYFSFVGIISKNPIVYQVDAITLNQSNVSLNLTDTLSLSVTAYPAGASNLVTWSSSDETIATVSSDGVVTGRKADGSTIITATSTVDSSRTASCQVTTYYEEGSGTLKFNGIKYPHTYNKNKSITWSGTVESDVELGSVQINLYTSSNKYTQNATISDGAKKFNMSSLGDSAFKKLSTGKFIFELIATDVVGRKIAFSNSSCQAKTSGDQVYYDAPGTYTRPTLKGSGELNGHLYEVYESGARLWDVDRNFAREKGGHLATISDSVENDFICNLITNSGSTYAYIGGYYNSGWHWVDGSSFDYHPWRSDVPSDGSLEYSAVIGIAPASARTWGKALKTEMKNYVVEYEPALVKSIVLEGTNIMVVGDKQVLTTTVLPANAYNKSLIYTSSNTDCATIDLSTGEIDAVGEGETIIRAIAQDGSGTVGEMHLFVQHKPIPVTGVKIKADSNLYTEPDTVVVPQGTIFTLTAEITPSDADNQFVRYGSFDESVAYIEPYSATVEAIAPGECILYGTISEELTDTSYNSTLRIIVLPISGTCGTNATWTYQDGVLTISGTGAMDNTYNITNSGEDTRPWAPYKESIHTLVIEPGITSIEEHCFEALTVLKNVTIPSSVTLIDFKAFRMCRSLETITIPDSVKTLGGVVFDGCTSLKSVKLSSSLTSIPYRAFYNCTKLQEITIPTTVKSIAWGAFYNCQSLTSVVIPDSVNTIAYSCFNKCISLITVTLPKNLKVLNYNTFAECTALKSIVIPDGVTTIGCRAFANCTALTSITVPASVTAMDVATDGDNGDTGVFYNTGNVTIYCIGDSAAHMYAVDNGISFILTGGVCGENTTWCYNNGILTISGTGKMTNYDSAEQQPWNSFAGSVTTLSISEGVTSTGSYAFEDFIALTDAALPSTLTSIGTRSFARCSALEGISIPDACTEIGSLAFSNCSKLQSFVFPPSVRIISDRAFYACKQITSYVIPDSVVSIKNHAFMNNTALQSIIIPDSVTEINPNAFEGSTNVTITCYAGSTAHSFAKAQGIPYELLSYPLSGFDFKLPGEMTVVGEEAFSGIAAKRVRLGEKVTKISSSAFANCPNLTCIYIPDGCTGIASNAFTGAGNLTVYGHDGSYAEFYAGKNGYDFINVDQE